MGMLLHVKSNQLPEKMDNEIKHTKMIPLIVSWDTLYVNYML